MSTLTRFLGGSPLAVLAKLAIASVIAGVVMSTFGWTPVAIIEGIVDTVRSIWALGFDALSSSVQYFLLGAAVVVPVFLVIRILSYRSS